MPKFGTSRAKSSLKLNVEQVFARRGIIHAYTWMRRSGISKSMAINLLKGDYDKFPMTAMSILCEQLWCTPNDLLTWQPLRADAMPAHHPLQAMVPEGGSMSIADKAERLTTAQLKSVNKIMDDMMEKGGIPEKAPKKKED